MLLLHILHMIYHIFTHTDIIFSMIENNCCFILYAAHTVKWGPKERYSDLVSMSLSHLAKYAVVCFKYITLFMLSSAES